MSESTQPVRFGMLGAAGITPMSLIEPAIALKRLIVLEAVAARDISRAQAFARKHKIKRVLESYDALINDPNVDAIYNALPNSHHKEWTLNAIRAKKHVLCEKPMALNEEEAREMHQAAVDNEVLCLEAFHFRFHPLAKRLREVIASGEIGNLKEVSCFFQIPVFSKTDIRYNLNLGGGATMDTGCYCLNMMRMLTQDLGEPVVVSAKAKEYTSQVDIDMEADLLWQKSGVKGKMKCSIFKVIPEIKLVVKGVEGEISVTNWVAPQIFYYSFTVRRKDGHKRSEDLGSNFRKTVANSYRCQLESFCKATQVGIHNGSKPEEVKIQLPYHPKDCIANMRLVDSVYQKAGLRPRGEFIAVTSRTGNEVSQQKEIPTEKLRETSDCSLGVVEILLSTPGLVKVKTTPELRMPQKIQQEMARGKTQEREDNEKSNRRLQAGNA